MQKHKKGIDNGIWFILFIYGLFIVFAFLMNSPREIWEGLVSIYTSRSILVSDYMEIGGIGAALVNAVLTGIGSLYIIKKSDMKLNGALIMAIWLSTGFALFGKNLLNVFPITLGVWLYSKYQREPFRNYVLVAILSATLAPVVSELLFSGVLGFPFNIVISILMGLFVGFIIPEVASHALRVHSGYNLYNVGFAGGLIAMVISFVASGMGITFTPVIIWSTAHQTELFVALCILSFILIGYGMYSSKDGIRKKLKRLYKDSGRLVSDFYIPYGNVVYINMGLLCLFATLVVKGIGADLNGPTIGCIFTIVGFGAFGKHLRNVIPIMIGAMISIYFNTHDLTSPGNVLALLLSTGLAPIAGEFGIFWGLITGFIHVNFAIHMSSLNSGLNLYNNGFAGGFVSLIILSLQDSLRRVKEE